MSYFADPYLLTDLLSFNEQLGWNAFIETGTERGNSARIVTTWIRDLYTCESEVYENFYDFHMDSYEDYFKVYFGVVSKASHQDTCFFWNESSLTALPKIFNVIKEKTPSIYTDSNFYLYLDAHIDFSDNPSTVVLDELEIVANHKLTPLIIIHDFDTKRERWGCYRFDEISLDLNYVRDAMDKIYGYDKWDYMFNKRSRQPWGPSQGCAYFWPKSLNIDKEII